MQYTEVWRTIPGYTNYQVSNLGRVKHIGIDVICKDKKLHFPEHILKLCADSDGKVYVNFESRSWYVHRLVAEAFLHIDSNSVVCHIDGDYTNNSVTNLEVINYSDKYRLDLQRGVRPPPPPNSGKPVMCIETGKIYTNIKTAAEDTKLSPESVSTSAYLNRTIKGHTFTLLRS